MKNTHILIKLEDLNGINGLKLETKNVIINYFEKRGKQICLEKGSIDEIALKEFPIVADYLGKCEDGTKHYGKDFNEPRRNAYKQAFRDIIK